jgi:hypothetical protein
VDRILEVGKPILVRYQDHTLFHDMTPEAAKIFTRETIGWVDYEDEESIRIIWERFAMPDPPNESKTRATGLVILKKTILEIRKIA